MTEQAWAAPTGRAGRAWCCAAARAALRFQDRNRCRRACWL